MDNFLYEEGIFRIDWPARFPDMNLIEHVCDILKEVLLVADHPQKQFRCWKILFYRSGREYFSPLLITRFIPWFVSIVRSSEFQSSECLYNMHEFCIFCLSTNIINTIELFLVRCFLLHFIFPDLTTPVHHISVNKTCPHPQFSSKILIYPNCFE